MFTFPFNCFYKLNGLTLLYLSQNLILLNLNVFTITNYSFTHLWYWSDHDYYSKKIEKNHNAQVLRKHFFLATVPHSRLKFILHCNTTSLYTHIITQTKIYSNSQFLRQFQFSVDNVLMICMHTLHIDFKIRFHNFFLRQLKPGKSTRGASEST